MAMVAGANRILEEPERAFRIIECFAALGMRRKAILSERLFQSGRESFEGTVRLFWPEAQAQDVKKLEKFLIILKSAQHTVH